MCRHACGFYNRGDHETWGVHRGGWLVGWLYFNVFLIRSSGSRLGIKLIYTSNLYLLNGSHCRKTHRRKEGKKERRKEEKKAPTEMEFRSAALDIARPEHRYLEGPDGPSFRRVSLKLSHGILRGQSASGSEHPGQERNKVLGALVAKRHSQRSFLSS